MAATTMTSTATSKPFHIEYKEYLGMYAEEIIANTPYNSNRTTGAENAFDRRLALLNRAKHPAVAANKTRMILYKFPAFPKVPCCTSPNPQINMLQYIA